MRLWHKDLIKVLPRKQLLSQWRECCCIAANIAHNGSPRHPLVNIMMEYSADDFRIYTKMVIYEMVNRGYKVNEASKKAFDSNMLDAEKFFSGVKHDTVLYKGWHEPRYFLQCYYNLQEKYDRGVLTADEWDRILCHMEEVSFEKMVL